MTIIVNGLLLRGQQILMAHRAPSRRTYPDTWSFPGGHVEVGESLEQALIRELSEEIGVIAKSWTYIQSFVDQLTDPSDAVTFHFFSVDNWTGEPMNNGDEHTEIRWIECADAPQMPNLTFSSYIKLFETLKTT